MERRFEANTDCPKCGHLAVHWLRAPRPMSSKEYEHEYAMWQSENTVEVMLWATGVVREIHATPMPPFEPAFEVIRTCIECAQTWGEI